MESSLKNMVLTLFAITLVSATALGFIYNVTKEPIEASKKAKTANALGTVLEDYDNDPSQDTTTLIIDDIAVIVYTARQNGTATGYAVETLTKKGFSGNIKMMVGFRANGEIINIDVLEHDETPGLGSKMADPDNVLLVSFQGKNPADLKLAVKKDGGDIDVITASTISSRAYTDAVERAYKAYQAVALGMGIAEGEKTDYFKLVLPTYDNLPQETGVYVYTNNDANVYKAELAGEIVGYAVETTTDKGYNGNITLLVGFDLNDRITGIVVTEQSETEGFGAQITEPGNPLEVSFVGQRLSDLKLALKSAGGDIDVITASTISSQAYIEAVENAWKALVQFKSEGDNNE